MNAIAGKGVPGFTPPRKTKGLWPKITGGVGAVRGRMKHLYLQAFH